MTSYHKQAQAVQDSFGHYVRYGEDRNADEK